MGIDLEGRSRVKSNNKRESSTPNPYLRLLIKLYKFLARRTNSKFNKVILKRLLSTRVQRYPISLSRIAKIADNAQKKSKIVVIVANILNDERMLTVPKMRVCALKVSDRARERILSAGGEVLTFDQLARHAPTGSGTLLLRGGKRREALRHFGLKRGQKRGHAAPYVGKSNSKKTA